MKVSLLANPSYVDKAFPPGWPVPARDWDPALGTESMAQAYDVYDAAFDLGFDWLAVSEHHYFPSLLGPNPMLVAATLANRYPTVGIAVLGAVLPQVNPVRVAEEYATLDTLSGGRLIAGMFRGLPNEYLAYATNPAQAREMFDEAFELILRAWTEPEPFWWEGRYYRFPVVSVWPRPVQQPRPPIVASGTSPQSAAFAGAQRLKLGLTHIIGTERCAEMVRIYRAAAGEAGWAPSAEDVLYRARAYVADSDARAEADCRRYEVGDFQGPLAPPPERRAAQAAIMAEITGGRGGRGQVSPKPPGKGTMPEYYGNPDTVARQIGEDARRIGYGVLDLNFDSFHLPHDHALHSLELFGTEVLPQLRAA
ncbi:MAG TPA: LLM class flavin-dependent oxidoreductase [Solirubrobacteraceae bacterium]|nr:LLM class flavin-dependent oxidoreductase [Solirubrobacteraceae bacterium]